MFEDKLASINSEMVKKIVKDMETIDGNFSQTKLWSLKKKLCPRADNVPTAKVDEKGNILTTPEALKGLYKSTYMERLKGKEILEEHKDLYELKMKLWSSRLENLRMKKSKDWSLDELNKALKCLRNNRARDSHQMISELFKEGTGGEDLKKSLLLLFNGAKSSLIIPDFLTQCTITSINKKKGSSGMELEKERGIFNLTVLKKI